jgi:hypothetical protein
MRNALAAQSSALRQAVDVSMRPKSQFHAGNAGLRMQGAAIEPIRRQRLAYGFNRFLTTHTGSLARPDDPVRMMAAREEGCRCRSRRRTPACTGPIGVGDVAAAMSDVDNLKPAIAGVNAGG